MLLIFICFDERNLLGNKKQTGGVADRFAGLFINGDSYELLRRNFQHFSKSIFKYLYDCKWDDPKRLGTTFSLQDMTAIIRRNTGEVVTKTLRKIFVTPEKEFNEKMEAFREQVQRTRPEEIEEWDFFMRKKNLWRAQLLGANAPNLHTDEDYEIRLR